MMCFVGWTVTRNGIELQSEESVNGGQLKVHWFGSSAAD
jgi:hypothetical protein